MAALVAKRGFGHLKAPIERVATADVPIPFSPGLEQFVEATQGKIEAAVREALGRRRPLRKAARPARAPQRARRRSAR
jgi:pyruvate/2-oxoglutarate/acetoin dehydrogenase E1 component